MVSNDGVLSTWLFFLWYTFLFSYTGFCLNIEYTVNCLVWFHFVYFALLFRWKIVKCTTVQNYPDFDKPGTTPTLSSLFRVDEIWVVLDSNWNDIVYFHRCVYVIGRSYLCILLAHWRILRLSVCDFDHKCVLLWLYNFRNTRSQLKYVGDLRGIGEDCSHRWQSLHVAI